jgi:hypothetical protein
VRNDIVTVRLLCLSEDAWHYLGGLSTGSRLVIGICRFEVLYILEITGSNKYPLFVLDY